MCFSISRRHSHQLYARKPVKSVAMNVIRPNELFKINCSSWLCWQIFSLVVKSVNYFHSLFERYACWSAWRTCLCDADSWRDWSFFSSAMQKKKKRHWPLFCFTVKVYLKRFFVSIKFHGNKKKFACEISCLVSVLLIKVLAGIWALW